MVKIEAVIRPHKLDDVKLALESLGIEDITSSVQFERPFQATMAPFSPKS